MSTYNVLRTNRMINSYLCSVGIFIITFYRCCLMLLLCMCVWVYVSNHPLMNLVHWFLYCVLYMFIYFENAPQMYSHYICSFSLSLSCAFAWSACEQIRIICVLWTHLILQRNNVRIALCIQAKQNTNKLTGECEYCLALCVCWMKWLFLMTVYHATR